VPFPREARRTLIAIVLLSALAWGFVLWTAFRMDAPLVQLMMPMDHVWSASEAAAVWVMWMLMMVAMMLPSAAPMILIHRRIAAQRGAPQESRFFSLGYLVTQAGTGLLATLAQWGLQGAGLLSPMIILQGNTVAGVILVAAGVMQWTPFKHRCLAICRTPIGFFATGWQPGKLGAFRMGLKLGIVCLGCCWALMALLFVFGAMNLFAIAALSSLVATEKLLPIGPWLGRCAGIAFGLWGVWLVLAPGSV
jgi:predicted metal-binding membrane protein